MALAGATRLLAEARTLEDIRHLRNLAGAAQAYARAERLGLEAMNAAAEIKLRAERKGGELLRATALSGERRTRDDGRSEEVSRGATPPATLGELGISRDQSSDWQAIASLPEPAFEAHIAQERASGHLLSTSGVVSTARSHFAPLMSSASAEWYSPDHVVEAARDALGGIDLDPCAEPARAVPAARHFTKVDDGLAREWAGRVYLNPPYGRTIDDWTTKLRTDYDAGRVTAAVALLPARTETDWWATLDAPWICLIKGRLRFSDHPSSAPFPSAALYLGRDGDAFAAAFGRLGPVYQRVA